jgi:hypothetical protein
MCGGPAETAVSVATLATAAVETIDFRANQGANLGGAQTKKPAPGGGPNTLSDDRTNYEAQPLYRHAPQWHMIPPHKRGSANTFTYLFTNSQERLRAIPDWVRLSLLLK